MKNLTRKQKIEILEKMIKEIKRADIKSICFAFEDVTDTYFRLTFDYIPELLKYKPNYFTIFWFDPFEEEKRIEIIQKTINDLKGGTK